MEFIATLKKTLETVTGTAKPTAPSPIIRDRRAHATVFEDDGTIPNNPELPLIHYHSPVGVPDAGDPAVVFEELFKRNGWGESWRNGVYDYVHYHSSTHEVLGIARGEASVRFGGDKGKIFELHAGDVVILPAGTGHQCLSASKDLLVIGAYPPGAKYDKCTGLPQERQRALQSIPNVPLPAKDPVYGADGPLLDAWTR
jgi:uncharacterized protein YjlB